MKTNEKINHEEKRTVFAKLNYGILVVAILFFTAVKVRPQPMVNETMINSELELVENELSLEAWMLDANLFEEMILGSEYDCSEAELSLEAWMLDSELFQAKVYQQDAPGDLYASEDEEEIQLEPWMMDTNEFNVAFELAIK